jgi:hypothetical protein
MWTKMLTEHDNPVSDGTYPIWIKGISGREWLDYGVFIMGTWYLDGEDTNITSTKHMIMAWYQVPAFLD